MAEQLLDATIGKIGVLSAPVHAVGFGRLLDAVSQRVVTALRMKGRIL